MKTQSSLSIILMLSIFAPATGQSPTPSPAPSPVLQQQPQDKSGEDDEVVRITSNLVQVDAVVTDSKGRLVTDLTAEDFEILEDNRPQKITNLSFVSNETSTAQPTAAPKGKDAPPLPPPVRLRPEQVRRTLALVVDDLGLSFESAHYVRRALKKFVDDQMQPTDLVAIIRTGGGMGALQQFTSDKRQLYAAIERVRWNPQGRGGISSFAQIRTGATNTDEEIGDTGESARDLSEETEQFREELFTVGTLGALNYIIRGLKDLPGRKSVLLLTDGFKISSTPSSMSLNRPDSSSQGTGRNERVIEALRRLTDLANRASVVIYTMDPRGLATLGLTAADDVSGLDSDQIRDAASRRRDDFIESQDGPIYLARQTGGFAIRNSNDLSGGIRRVLEDQKGYYLIGYRPDESTFDPKTGSRRFYKLSIKVKRPGLRVRTRSGFYGFANTETRKEVSHNRVEQMIAALTSPFNSNGINLRLTSLFGRDAKAGAFVRSLLHIDGRDITFTKEADGWNKAVLDIIVITFGDNGTIVDQLNKTYTLRVRDDAARRAMENGFTYTINLPIKKAGAYQLRAALRDSTSERVGSASQFIEIPDIKKNRLMLSGLVISGSERAKVAASNNNNIEPGADGVADQADPQANAVLRRFKRGMVLLYDYLIFDARLDKATSRPQLQTQVRLFRDGQPIFTGTPKPFDASNQTDLKRLIAGGALQLGTDMTPGEYVLQIIVTDTLVKGKHRTATQWIDFEITQ